MSPVLVIVEQIQRHQPFQMPLIQDDHVVQQVAPATSNPAFRNSVLSFRLALDAEVATRVLFFAASTF